eukprot:evm.model.NODE_34445_length_3222_cov_5.085351.1
MARTAGDKGERDCPPEEGASSLDVGTVDEGEGEEEGGEGEIDGGAWKEGRGEGREEGREGGGGVPL